jgi:hypothetical protein
MKRVFQLIAALFFATSLLAQVDVTVPWRGPFGDIGRGLVWGGTGAGGINNAFIISPVTPQSNVCVYVRNNNATSAHPYTFKAYINGDQRGFGYYATPLGWSLTQSQGHHVNPSTASGYQLAASQTDSILVTNSSAARIALVFSGATTQAGTPDTADIFFSAPTSGQCALNTSDYAEFTDDRIVTNGTTLVDLFGNFTDTLVAGTPQSYSACTFAAYSQNTSGVAPTLSIYVVSAIGNLAGYFVNDRVSFTARTVGSLNEEANVNADLSAVPTTTSNGSMAPGTVRNGNFGDQIQVKYVVGGGAGSDYNILFYGICH